MYDKILPDIIRRTRLINGLTQLETAKSCGISASYLCRLEKGGCLPSPGVLLRLANVLNISGYDILVCAAYAAINEPPKNDGYLSEIVSTLRLILAEKKAGGSNENGLF
jgi:transcriptional regulator with XRE-family HTH domain